MMIALVLIIAGVVNVVAFAAYIARHDWEPRYGRF